MKFRNFLFLLDSGCSSTIVIGWLIKITPKEEAVIHYHTQSGSITTNLKVSIDFNIPELSAKKDRDMY